MTTPSKHSLELAQYLYCKLKGFTFDPKGPWPTSCEVEINEIALLIHEAMKEEYERGYHEGVAYVTSLPESTNEAMKEKNDLLQRSEKYLGSITRTWPMQHYKLSTDLRVHLKKAGVL